MTSQFASTASSHTSEYLEPSELGTKQYWNNYYEEDLVTFRDEDAEVRDYRSLSSWFEDVKAPQKILKLLVSQEFPLAPCHFFSDGPNDCPSVLDLGTGNGHTLFQLRIQAGFRGQMVGLDYSKPSIQLARELAKGQRNCQDIKFEVMDVIRDDPTKESWWLEGGFDLVLDKGTFDAISLCDEVVESPASHPLQTSQALARIYTLYPSRALGMVKPGGFLLVTSCNWTQNELINWFTACGTKSDGGISIWRTVEYPKFRFGGQEGQGVCTVCFRKDSAAA